MNCTKQLAKNYCAVYGFHMSNHYTQSKTSKIKSSWHYFISCLIRGYILYACSESKYWSHKNHDSINESKQQMSNEQKLEQSSNKDIHKCLDESNK